MTCVQGLLEITDNLRQIMSMTFSGKMDVMDPDTICNSLSSWFLTANDPVFYGP